MTGYRLVSQPDADLDVEAAIEWYENERSGLGLEFLGELRATYDRIVAGPLTYQVLRSGIRRALLARFPYAVYFAVEDDHAVVLAVLHASRNPADWQQRQSSPAVGADRLELACPLRASCAGGSTPALATPDESSVDRNRTGWRSGLHGCRRGRAGVTGEIRWHAAVIAETRAMSKRYPNAAEFDSPFFWNF